VLKVLKVLKVQLELRVEQNGRYNLTNAKDSIPFDPIPIKLHKQLKVRQIHYFDSIPWLSPPFLYISLHMYLFYVNTTFETTVLRRIFVLAFGRGRNHLLFKSNHPISIVPLSSARKRLFPNQAQKIHIFCSQALPLNRQSSG
jgi:hypothetical protein